MNKSVLLVLAGQPFLLGQAVKIACSQEQPEAKFSSTEMKAGERAMDERAMDERAMDAAMNPCEERHRDEYGRQSLARGRSPMQKRLATYSSTQSNELIIVFYYTAVRILAQQESHSKASRHKAWKQEIKLRNGEVFPPTHPDDRGENIENARLL